MSHKRKNFRLPYVLEMGEPVGGGMVAAEARRRFHANKQQAQNKGNTDKLLDGIARALWTNPEYWADHGEEMPTMPYPGLEAIKRITGGRA